MAEQPKQAQLRDVLPYEPESYLSEQDLALLQTTFRGNDRLIKILRKLLLPTAFDPELPIEELSGDAWMADTDFRSMQTEEVKPVVLARQDAIKFVLGGLIKLKVIANQKQETPMEKAYRASKDSTK